MGRDTHERRIGPHLYRVTLLGAREGERMALKLAKLLAPSSLSFVDGILAGAPTPAAVAAAANGGGGAESVTGGGDGEARGAAMASMALGASWGITKLIELVDPAELEAMQMALAKHTEVVMGELEPNLDKVFDDHFAGHYDWLGAWFSFALEVNFSSFFAASASATVRALAGRLTKLMASLSLPQPSTRPTGASTASSPASSTAASVS